VIDLSNLEIIRGDSEPFEITLADEDGAPIDLTGAIIYFTVKKRKSDSDANASISKVITDHTSPENGESLISLTAEDTNIEPGTYFWDIQIDRDGDIDSVKYGILKVFSDVTRGDEVS